MPWWLMIIIAFGVLFLLVSAFIMLCIWWTHKYR